MVVYCDPPYYSTDRRYTENDVDIQALTDALLEQKGQVAVSGYGEEWNHLGWRVVEKEVRATASGKNQVRTERLWMNYPPLQMEADMFGEVA